jgi:putative endonuclease
MFFVYILHSSAFDKHYIGQTKDLQERLRHHNSGLDAFTKKYMPWSVLFYVAKETRTEAISLERKLKNLSRERRQEFINKYTRDY